MCSTESSFLCSPSLQHPNACLCTGSHGCCGLFHLPSVPVEDCQDGSASHARLTLTCRDSSTLTGRGSTGLSAICISATLIHREKHPCTNTPENTQQKQRLCITVCAMLLQEKMSQSTGHNCAAGCIPSVDVMNHLHPVKNTVQQ